MKQRPRIAIVGAGAVGIEMVRLLKAQEFPRESITILARTERTEWVDGEAYQVKATTPEAFDPIDLAFFAGTEGAKGASREFGWEAVNRGCVVIDNGDDFRMDQRVPLVIPEINAASLMEHQGFIANPNCSTIITLMALAPLHRVARIKRIVASTYQAVSGSGAEAVTLLEQQAKARVTGTMPVPAGVYPHQIAFNVIPMVGSAATLHDESTEELKMRRETHKILGDASIGVTTTCVRVPVYNGHSVAITVEFEKKMTPHVAHELLQYAPGVRLADDPANHIYPMPLDATGIPEVLVGRIRQDPTVPNGISMFVSGDNLWKGAALNAIQIAEELLVLP